MLNGLELYDLRMKIAINDTHINSLILAALLFSMTS